MPRIESHLTVTRRMVLALASGGLLALPFIHPALYLCAWIGWVPLLIAMEGVGLKAAYGLGALCGISFFMNSGYWLIEFIQLSKGYSALPATLLAGLYCLYSAQLMAMICVLFKLCNKLRVAPSILLFPLLVTLGFAYFPSVFELRLGGSQALFSSAIQAIEFTGVHGLDTIIALVNFILYQALFRKSAYKVRRVIYRQICAVLLILLWFGWGSYAKQHWQTKVAEWPIHHIGLVQPNEAPRLSQTGFDKTYTRSTPPEMQWTEALAQAGAELVIWPEANYKGVFDIAPLKDAYAGQISKFQVSLLLQDIEHVTLDGIAHKFNSAALITPDTLQGPYRKHRRIAFGEYIPLLDHIPTVQQWLETYLGTFLNKVNAGDRYHTFDTGTLRIVPLICYETTFPKFVARAVQSAINGKQRGAVLIALSRNSWFGKSIQPYQHAYTSVLRAVENRLPLVHVLNNGPSIVAMPHGEITTLTPYHQEGAYLVDLPYSDQSQGSFYSRYPALYLNLILGLLCLVTLTALGRRMINLRQ